MVLIIGILAAVALPQYQKAVLKTRLSEAVINVRSIYDGLELYKLSNGHYPTVEDVGRSGWGGAISPTTLSQFLDIEIPNLNDNFSFSYYPHATFYYTYTPEDINIGVLFGTGIVCAMTAVHKTERKIQVCSSVCSNTTFTEDENGGYFCKI